MAKKEKSIVSSKLANEISQCLHKCEYCRGKDGKKKDVYETFQLALDTVKFIEESRGIYLSIYKCPIENGWHLTKNHASFDFIERKNSLFQNNNNIPLKASDGLWELVQEEINENDDFDENGLDDIIYEFRKNYVPSNPIVKIECNAEVSITGLSGKVMEIVKNVNIEKIFKINIQNAFFVSMIKNLLDGIVHQITIYVENKEKNKLDSYTILIKDSLLIKHKIIKGNDIKINLIGKKINNVSAWCCNKVEK